MARLLPDFISEDCKSSAERRLFERFRRELPDSYLVLHSLGVAKHRYKLYSEADFVVIHEDAVVVFEVKGGRVLRKDGVWYFINRFGEMNKKRESPMQQAASVAAALQHSVSLRFGYRSPQARVAFGAFTFFPDIEFKEQSAEWDLKRVYDIDTWRKPLRVVVDDAIAFARAERERVSDHRPARLDEAEAAALLEFMRGDFEKVPSLGTIIDGHADDMVRLAAQQYSILDHISKNQRMVVEGPAGTGKTLLAMECARRHAAVGRRVLFVCFNRLLADHLETHAVRNRSSVNISINTLHSHCLSVLRQAGINVDADTSEREVFSIDIPRLVADAVDRLPELVRWDVLVVDEGQDIAAHAPFVAALGRLLRGGFENGTWMWFEDPRQRIIKQNGGERFDIGTYRPFNFTLTRNWRNTNEVATFFSVASRFPLPELSGIRGPAVGKIACPAGKGLEKLSELIAELMRTGVRGEHIVLLSSVGEKHALFSGLASIGGLALVRYDARRPAAAGEVRYASVFTFKGLEAKVVILTDVDDLFGEDGRMGAYVGMSRATSALYAIFSEAAASHFETNRMEFADLTHG